MILRGAQTGTFEAETSIGMVRGEAQRLRVFRHRPVVVLALLGQLAGSHAGGDAPGRRKGKGQGDRQSPGESVSYRRW